MRRRGHSTGLFVSSEDWVFCGGIYDVYLSSILVDRELDSEVFAGLEGLVSPPGGALEPCERETSSLVWSL